ncbi:MAG: hypothetical protein ACREVC_05045 [Burkholderiales bacterium]
MIKPVVWIYYTVSLDSAEVGGEVSLSMPIDLPGEALEEAKEVLEQERRAAELFAGEKWDPLGYDRPAVIVYRHVDRWMGDRFLGGEKEEIYRLEA